MMDGVGGGNGGVVGNSEKEVMGNGKIMRLEEENNGK